MADPDPQESLPTQSWVGPEPPPPDAPPGPSPAPANPAPSRGGWRPPTPEQLQPSFPQYEIQGVLGYGGMGAVYKGWQTRLDRYVAIKILPPGLENGRVNFTDRFQREAKAMARFSHPGIVAVYDAGETPGGLLYFVMEFVEGTDVEKIVRENGPLPPAHALSITAHVCDALAYAHKRGVIHRDIKPANIMLDADGQVKIADFGLAKVASDDSAVLATGSQVSMGTLDFIAPEALYGMSQVDHRADLYAVGVMFYQMLTGEIPRGLFEMPSIRRPELDPRFDAIITHAMQKDPEKRYASASEIRTDLDQILTFPVPHRSAVEEPPPPSPPKAEVRAEAAASPAHPIAASPDPGDRRSNRWIWLSTGIAATLLLFAGGAIFFHDKSSAEADRAAPLPPVAAALPSLVPRQTLDLIALTDPVKDRVTPGATGQANTWEKSGGVLRYKSDGFAGSIVAPVAINSQHYEIEVVFARQGGGTSQLELGFPTMPGNFVPFVFLSPGMKLVRDSAGPPWPSGLPDRGRIALRYDDGGENGPAHLVTQFDGRIIADFRQEILRWQKPMDPHPEFPNQALPSIFSVRDSFDIIAWTLRIYEGEAKPLRVIGP